MSDTMRHIEHYERPAAHGSHLNLTGLMHHGPELALRSAACSAALPALALFDVQGTLPPLAREGELLMRSMLGGAIKEAEKDPCGTVVKAAAAIGVGAVLGVAATAASPMVAGTAVAVGMAGTGAWLWDTFNTFDSANNDRNKAVAQAVQQTWTTADRSALNDNVHRLENNLGRDSLELGLGLLSCATASGASKFVPGLVCREVPNIGFKFFSQGAIEKAFPSRSREFQIADMQPLEALRSGEPVQVLLKEILGQTKSGANITGPEKCMLIGHNLATNTDLPNADLLATCRPELLEPLARIKSVLQQAADVELQIAAAVKRLRFLTLDNQQRPFPSENFPPLERFILGEQKAQPLGEFVANLQAQLAHKALPDNIAEGLGHHSLHEISSAFTHLPYKIAAVKGVGAESIVFELAKDNDAPIFAAENVSPSDVVLKVSDPKYAAVDDIFGTRPFDAQRYGEFEYGKKSAYVAYLQEHAEPVALDDVDTADVHQLQRQLEAARACFYDEHGDHKQLGYTQNGRLVVIDWFAVLREDQCNRPDELQNDFKPSR